MPRETSAWENGGCHLGKPQIQNDGVVGLRVAKENPFLAIPGGVDGIAGIGQRLSQLAVEIWIIFDDEYAHVEVLEVCSQWANISEVSRLNQGGRRFRIELAVIEPNEPTRRRAPGALARQGQWWITAAWNPTVCRCRRCRLRTLLVGQDRIGSATDAARLAKCRVGNCHAGADSM